MQLIARQTKHDYLRKRERERERGRQRKPSVEREVQLHFAKDICLVRINIMFVLNVLDCLVITYD